MSSMLYKKRAPTRRGIFVAGVIILLCIITFFVFLTICATMLTPTVRSGRMHINAFEESKLNAEETGYSREMSQCILHTEPLARMIYESVMDYKKYDGIGDKQRAAYSISA